MRKKILFLVHIEETFRKFFERKEDYIENIINKSEEYDRVYHFNSCIDDLETVEELRHIITDEIDWGWGYEPECFESNPEERKFLILSSGHEYTWIPPELRSFDWDNVEISLGGGCDGECLADMESILDELGVDYNFLYEMVYS